MDNYNIGRKIAFALFCSSALMFFSNFAWAERFPALNPPKISSDLRTIKATFSAMAAETPTTEWTYHKTADGSHPDGNEQQLMWLMNVARSDPTVEGIFLANLEDPDVVGALDYFDVDLQVLQDEFAGYSPTPPGAFDVRLYNAAKEHSEYLIGIDGQNHDQQFDRVDDAGFSYTSGRGSVFSYAKSALHGHAAWNIDWGTSDDGTGMQNPRGHRLATMSIDGNYTNVGIAAVPESDAGTTVGPLVVTGNYFLANTNVEDHFNRFLVGTVWEDLDGDFIYDPEEGVGGVTVMPDRGTYYAVTGSAGGYAIPILSPGDVDVSISGDGITGDSSTVTIGTDSVLLDFLIGDCSAVDGRADISGTVTYNGAPVCAMVLANGQHMFTCGDSPGEFSLNVPVDQNCDITLFAFASGLSPFKVVMGPEDLVDYDILMVKADAGSQETELTWQTAPGTSNSTWVRVSGTSSSSGVPLNSMILANGQKMFSNGTASGLDFGQFDLEVPLDANGQITLYGFTQGFAPFKAVFSP